MFSLIFDLDDTLYFQQDQFYAAVRQTNFQHTTTDIQQLYVNFQTASEAAYLLHDRGEISLAEMRQQRIQQAYASSGIEINTAQGAEWQLAYERAQGKIELSPVMVELFNQCQRHNIQLGLITNGPSDHQRRKINALGLSRWFSPAQILVSGDIGISKPDERIFHHLVRQLPQKTQRYYYIGDNPQNDMLGALKVGWHGIWLDCKGENFPSHQDVTVVHTQAELAKVIIAMLPVAN